MRSTLPVLAIALALAAGVNASACRADAVDKVIPAPLLDSPTAGGKGLEKAVLAGGCFWGMQGMFEHVRGVTQVVAGYAGGEASTATYEMVSTETTGHAESVEITFDPRQVSYGELLRLYFSVAHDPTQLDRQGPDSGPSYRSEIFFVSPEQERVAKAYIAQLERAKTFARPIVTKVEPLRGFYPAEDYHQDFLVRNPRHAYIVVNDLPKIAALERLYPDAYRKDPVLYTR